MLNVECGVNQIISAVRKYYFKKENHTSVTHFALLRVPFDMACRCILCRKGMNGKCALMSVLEKMHFFDKKK